MAWKSYCKGAGRVGHFKVVPQLLWL
jgi:hypothetical protein